MMWRTPDLTCDGQPFGSGSSRSFLSRHRALWCFLTNSVEKHDNIQIINRLPRLTRTAKIAEPLHHQSLAQFQQAKKTFEKVLSVDPGHKAARDNRDLVSYLDRVSFREILSSLANREYDHAVDLIEASVQKGEEPDWLLRVLALSLPQTSREDLFYRPITKLLVKRKLWDAALTLLEQWETDLPDSAPEARARRGGVYLQTDQFQQARETFEKLSPQHQGAKRSLDLLSNLDLVAYGEILNSVINREHDHAVDLAVNLIEASIQKGEDPDRLLRALALSFEQGSQEDFFYQPITKLLVEPSVPTWVRHFFPTKLD